MSEQRGGSSAAGVAASCSRIAVPACASAAGLTGAVAAGERVATSLAEGGADRLVNARMARKLLMRWSERGAFNVLQVRAAQFNQRFAQQPIAA